MSILHEIFEKKRAEVAGAKMRLPEPVLEAQALATPVPPSFQDALRRSDHLAPRLIAEVKQRSPSKGLLALDFDPVKLAVTYVENGAAAISVLTDAPYFGGHLDHLRQVASTLQVSPQPASKSSPSVPVLRKDFIFDRYQLLEARLAGASAVLLIAAMLTQTELQGLIQAAHGLDLEALVEIHTKAELETALAAGATLIGINNRDLHTFHVNLGTTLHLMEHIPPGITCVAESGIHTRADILRLAAAGVHAILVGEAIVTARDRPRQVQLFSGQSAAPVVKICGVRTIENALAAAEAGAEMLGLNFYPASKRYLEVKAAQAIQEELRRQLAHPPALVGVFVNAPVEEIQATLAACSLDYAQLSGDEAPTTLQAMSPRAFKAVRPASNAEAQALSQAFATRFAPPALLVDAYRPGEYGGTGQRADWPIARNLARQFPILLAGGLDPSNVTQAIQAVQPWGVDVASGVESSPGIQEPVRIQAFIQAAQATPVHSGPEHLNIDTHSSPFLGGSQ